MFSIFLLQVFILKLLSMEVWPINKQHKNQQFIYMKKRQIFIIAGILVLAGGIFAAVQLASGGKKQKKQGQADTGGKAAAGKDSVIAQPVNAIAVENSPVQTYVNLTGRLYPQDKIDIYAEVTGVLQGGGKPFKEGVYYRRGEILLNINSEEARQNLIAQKSGFLNTLSQVVPDLKLDYPEIFPRFKNYLLNLDMEKSLPPLPEVETAQQKLFLTGRQVYSQYYNIKQVETRLNKYQVRAPFAGVITEASINNGTLVRQGQKAGEFVNTGVYEMWAAVSLSEIGFLSVGDQVSLSPTNSSENYTGRIVRINEKVNQETQTVKVFIRVTGSGLRTGMYMDGKARARTFEGAVEVPSRALVDQNKVFIMEDSTARLQQVEVLKFSEDTAVVRGLRNGALVINESRNAAFEGSKVTSARN